MKTEVKRVDEEFRIGTAFRELREERELTIKELSYMVFLTEEQLINIESGRELPDQDTILMVSNLFSIIPSELEKGYIVERISQEETMKILHEIRTELTQLQDDTVYFKKFIQKWELGEFLEEKSLSHYDAIEVQKGENSTKENYEYIIKDVINDKTVCNVNGEKLIFQRQEEAEFFAKDLNYQMDTGLLKAEKGIEADVEVFHLAR